MGLENKQMLLKDLVASYFTEGEAEEFYSQFLKNLESGRSGAIMPDSGSEINSFHSYFVNTQIDQLITFAEQKLSGQRLLTLLSYLGEFSILNGEMDSALNIFFKITAVTAEETKFSDIYANANVSIGEVYSRQAKWALSIKYIKKALTVFNTSHNNKGKARCENLFGSIYGDMGNIQKSKDHFEKCFELVKTTRDLSLLGMVEINLGLINLIQEDFENALLYLKRALVSFKQTLNHKRIAEIYYNTGLVYMKTGKYDQAINEFDESLSISQRLGYLPLMVLAYLSKAQVYLKINDNNLASAFADKSMEIAYRLNDRLSVADIYKIKGVIQRNLNNFEKAENYLLTSLRINKELENQYNFAETSFELGLLYKDLGKTKQSSEYLNSAKGYFKKIKAFDEMKKIDLCMN